VIARPSILDLDTPPARRVPQEHLSQRRPLRHEPAHRRERCRSAVAAGLRNIRRNPWSAD